VICKAKPQPESYYITLYQLLNDPDFINSLGLYLGQRDIAHFNPGRAALRSTDKAKVLQSMKTQEEMNLQQLIAEWQADIICNRDLALEMTDGACERLDKTLTAITKRWGVTDQGKIKIADTEARVKSLRQHDKWHEATAPAKRSEMLKATRSYKHIAA
jgi:Mn-containing catalase